MLIHQSDPFWSPIFPSSADSLDFASPQPQAAMTRSFSAAPGDPVERVDGPRIACFRTETGWWL